MENNPIDNTPFVPTKTGKGKKLIFILVAIVVIGAIGYFTYDMPLTKSNQAAKDNSSANSPAPVTVDEFDPSRLTPEGLAIVKEQMLNAVSRKEPLTEAEKRGISDAISGTKLSQYNFTHEEITKILTALNKN